MSASRTGTATSEARIDALISQLTVEEKVSLLSGVTFWTTAAVERLGIPAIKVTDGPAGARGAGGFTGGTMTSASFPAPVAIASTWDVDLVRELGGALAEEAKSKGATVLLGPTVNIHRSPLNGRNFECYSEDPYLSARLAVAYVEGLQAKGVAATVKHFVGNDSEYQRNTISSDVDERTLREIYLPPFEAAVREAGAWAVMAGYNRLNGVYAGEHRELIIELLKGEWGFDGLLMSDWFGTQSTVDAANNGLDLEMPGPAIWRGEKLVAAITSGEVDPAAIDESVRRVLRLIERVGAFANPGIAPEQAIDDPNHRRIARRIAAEGAVLLKNTGGVLPLGPEHVNTIAVIGTHAKRPSTSGGGSAQLNAHSISTPYDAITERAWDARIAYEPGVPSHRFLPRVDPALLSGGMWTVDYFNNPDLAGEPGASERVPGSEQLWLGNVPEGIHPRNFSARMHGTLTPQESGAHQFSLLAGGKARLRIDGEEAIDNWTSPQPGVAYFGMASREEFVTLDLEADRPYRIELDYSTAGGVLLGMRFGHLPPWPENAIDRAASAAARSDVAVVFAGTSGEWETEAEDRTTMDLPGEQNALIAAVAAANPRTVVVLQTGSPVTMPWLSDVAAVVQGWFGGQENGGAIADVLFGDVNPSGRLTQTYPVRLEDNPAFINYPGDNGHVLYGERIFVGYRYYDKKKVEPLFPFGFGLSYTEWVIANLEASTLATDLAEPVRVRLSVTNAGERPGQAVVQVYVRHVDAAVSRPERELKAFAKVAVAPKESAHVEFDLDRRAFAYWDDHAHEWVAAAGDYVISAGESSRDLREHLTITVGETIRFR